MQIQLTIVILTLKWTKITIDLFDKIICQQSVKDATYKVSKVVLCQIIVSKVNSPQFRRFHVIHHCSKLVVSVDANTVTDNNVSI